MKKIFLLLALLSFALVTFGQQTTPAKVQVYFFHGTHRCQGCINAEKAAVKALNDLYKDLLEKGTIVFQSVNVEEEKNQSLVNKYEISWNSLLFVKNDGSGVKSDLTQQAFAYGSNPEELKPIIKKTVEGMLK